MRGLDLFYDSDLQCQIVGHNVPEEVTKTELRLGRNMKLVTANESVEVRRLERRILSQ